MEWIQTADEEIGGFWITLKSARSVLLVLSLPGAHGWLQWRRLPISFRAGFW
jgi:hypothetical protein